MLGIETENKPDGTYRARVKELPDGDWSRWSPWLETKKDAVNWAVGNLFGVVTIS